MENECEDENLPIGRFPEGWMRIQILPNGVAFQPQCGAAFCLYAFAACGWVGIPAICFGLGARYFSLEDWAGPALSMGSLLTVIWMATFICSYLERWPLRIVIDVRQRVVIVDEISCTGRWRQTEFSLDDFESLRVDSFRSKGGWRFHVVLVGEGQTLNLDLLVSGADANATARELARILAMPVENFAAAEP